jgi:hypothetical protein
MDLERARAELERAGVRFERGLSDGEVREIEARWELRFPPDLREWLQYALPVSKGWTRWRDPGPAAQAELAGALEWPCEGLCFDLEHNRFWLEEWGPRPAELEAAMEVVKRAVRAAPRLIPIYGHRYLPERPAEAGNPVFSVYQTDIIYYGASLEEYLEAELRVKIGGEKAARSGGAAEGTERHIELWSQLVERNAGG